MDPIQDLLAFEKVLVDWVVELRATDDEPLKKQKLLQLLALRDAIADTVDKLVPLRLQIAARGVTDDVKELDAITTRIKSETKTFETIDTIVDAATTVAEIAAKILATF